MSDAIQDKINGLEAVNRKIHMLYNSVPGGIFQCLFDEELTLLEMSEGFLNMIGYTREQVCEELGCSLKKLIEPGDFEASMAEVDQQLRIGNTKEIQYRLIHRDGHFINVLDRGTLLDDEYGRKAFYCIVVDVTKEKQMEYDLRMSLERYQIITNQTNDVIFEWDIRNDTLVVTSNWNKKFGKRKFANGVSLSEVLNYKHSPVFAPEDMHLVYKYIQLIKEGNPYLETELRICHEDGSHIWCRIRMTQQFDQQGKAIKVIGVLIDIDREIKQSQYLKKQAEQDALTGMYNKMTTQSLIRDYIQEADTSGVLMIVDIDNFKQVNDSLGHLYGDAVLSNLARSMNNSFRDTDILGRIGGDEFLIFLKGVSTIDCAQVNAEKVLRLFEELRVSGNQHHDISCSVGIAMFPGDGRDFATLYQRADYALYQAKDAGKNRYAFFDEGTMQRFLAYQKNPLSPITAKIDSNEERRVLNGEIVEYVFRILYNAKDIKKAISTILEIVGNYFSVSRAYIFENSEDGRYCNNTFEWCSAGIEPQIQNLQKVSYKDDLGGCYYENFDENNLFYCPDIRALPQEQQDVLAPQGIFSVLQCAITDNGEFQGYVGFDECRDYRYWTQDQIDMLSFIAEIISTFLLKRRARDQYKQENEGLRSVLDNQNSWIYVIDPETRALLFINRKTSEIAPNARIGAPCYKAFLNREERCVDCPADRIIDHCKNYTMEFYNPHLKVWSDADACQINWKGQDAIMLSCHDITRYKR